MMFDFFWNTDMKNQGQMVRKSYAQKSGAAEGEQGAAQGLTLTFDASARDWRVYRDGVEIGRGNACQRMPTVAEAMEMQPNKENQPNV